MALIEPDFSDVQDAIQPGTYKVVIKKGEVKQYQNGGSYVSWEMETTGEPEQKNNGRKIRDNTAVSGKAAFRLQALYRAATGKALMGSFDTEELVGKLVEVEVVDGMRNGEPTGYIEVKRVRPVSG